MEAVLKLDGPSRYHHFIKQAVDAEEVWGLYSDGWAMGSDDDGRPTFQLWPGKEYALLCANGEWSSYEAAEIPLEDLLDELLPNLERDGVVPSIFRPPAANPRCPRWSNCSPVSGTN